MELRRDAFKRYGVKRGLGVERSGAGWKQVSDCCKRDGEPRVTSQYHLTPATFITISIRANIKGL